MLGDRRLIIVLGLSRGGTNHLAQRIHGCAGVAGFTEGLSRLVLPTRNDNRQVLRREAIEAAVLKPSKSAFACGYWSFNKVNYTLVAYPEAWVKFLAGDSGTQTLVLLRNPLMVHQSRVAYVQRKKPQRRRWLQPEQLAREFLEMLAIAWRLPGAHLVFHEKSLWENHETLLRQTLNLAPAAVAVPTHCPTCRGELSRRRRTDDDPHQWLFCARCVRFIEGEGDYNFLRVENDPAAWRAKESDAARSWRDVDRVLRDQLGGRMMDFFAGGGHWSEDAPAEFRQILQSERDRWNRVPLDEILYPY